LWSVVMAFLTPRSVGGKNVRARSPRTQMCCTFGDDCGMPPTNNQLKFACDLADSNGVQLPVKARVDKQACSEFIDEQLAARGGLPSAKQLAFAERLANNSGVALPEEARLDRRLCSRFIDDQLDARGGGVPPTSKQLEFANALANKNGITLPEEVVQDMRACSRFIDQQLESERL